MFIVLLFLSAYANDGILVLKNGKRIPFADGYKVEAFVVSFTNTKGQPLSLPLKIVNMEATKALNEKIEQARIAANAPKPEPPKKKDSMVQLHESLEDNFESGSRSYSATKSKVKKRENSWTVPDGLDPDDYYILAREIYQEELAERDRKRAEQEKQREKKEKRRKKLEEWDNKKKKQ